VNQCTDAARDGYGVSNTYCDASFAGSRIGIALRRKAESVTTSSAANKSGNPVRDVLPNLDRARVCLVIQQRLQTDGSKHVGWIEAQLDTSDFNRGNRSACERPSTPMRTLVVKRRVRKSTSWFSRRWPPSTPPSIHGVMRPNESSARPLNTPLRLRWSEYLSKYR